jgi:hypothetical protein
MVIELIMKKSKNSGLNFSIYDMNMTEMFWKSLQ